MPGGRPRGRAGPSCKVDRQRGQSLQGWSWISEGNRGAASSLQRRERRRFWRPGPLARAGVTAGRRARPSGGSAEQPGEVTGPGGQREPCARALAPQPAPPDGAGGLQAGAVLTPARGTRAVRLRAGGLAAGALAAASPLQSLPSAGPRLREPRAQAPRPVTPGSSARGGGAGGAWDVREGSGLGQGLRQPLHHFWGSSPAREVPPSLGPASQDPDAC